MAAPGIFAAVEAAEAVAVVARGEPAGPSRRQAELGDGTCLLRSPRMGPPAAMENFSRTRDAAARAMAGQGFDSGGSHAELRAHRLIKLATKAREVAQVFGDQSALAMN